MSSPIRNITLYLTDLRDLFVAPALDPFAADEATLTGQSGLERVVRQLEVESIKQGNVTLTVILPSEKISLDGPARIRQAIDRYATLKTEENRRQLKTLRRHGWQSLLRGLVFLGI